MTRCRCGAENPDNANFCLACGRRLAAVPAADRDVLRTVTVVFTDVVDSVGLASRLGTETWRSVVSRYFEKARAVLEQYGGTVQKFAGDAVMAVFGVEELVLGEAINLAARLQSAAGPDEILIGHPTYRLVRDSVAVDPVEALRLRGIETAVTAWRLLGVTRARARSSVPTRPWSTGSSSSPSSTSRSSGSWPRAAATW